jgi:hypothetical protein
MVVGNHDVGQTKTGMESRMLVRRDDLRIIVQSDVWLWKCVADLLLGMGPSYGSPLWTLRRTVINLKTRLLNARNKMSNQNFLCSFSCPGARSSVVWLRHYATSWKVGGSNPR